MPTVSRSPHCVRLATFVVALLAAAPAFTRDAHAAVVGVTNANQPFAINTDIPTVVRSDPADGVIRVWDEVQDFTLAKRIRVDRLTSTGKKGFVAAGTTLHSHMIQWDASSVRPPTDLATADFEFDGEIIAIIFKTKTLRRTNGLRLPGVTHQRFKYHGLERGDRVVMGDDLVSLAIDWITGRPGDWIRVITAPAVPAPPTGDDDDDDTPTQTGDDDTPPTGDDDDDNSTPVSAPTPGALPAGLALMGAAMLRRRRRR